MIRDRRLLLVLLAYLVITLAYGALNPLFEMCIRDSRSGHWTNPATLMARGSATSNGSDRITSPTQFSTAIKISPSSAKCARSIDTSSGSAPARSNKCSMNRGVGQGNGIAVTVGVREGVGVTVGIVVGVSMEMGVAVDVGAVVGAGIVGGEEDLSLIHI